jgi:hypothetical protein
MIHHLLFHFSICFDIQLVCWMVLPVLAFWNLVSFNLQYLLLRESQLETFSFGMVSVTFSHYSTPLIEQV